MKDGTLSTAFSERDRSQASYLQAAAGPALPFCSKCLSTHCESGAHTVL